MILLFDDGSYLYRTKQLNNFIMKTINFPNFNTLINFNFLLFKSLLRNSRE